MPKKSSSKSSGDGVKASDGMAGLLAGKVAGYLVSATGR
jgi:hypothetical protein